MPHGHDFEGISRLNHQVIKGKLRCFPWMVRNPAFFSGYRYYPGGLAGINFSALHPFGSRAGSQIGSTDSPDY